VRFASAIVLSLALVWLPATAAISPDELFKSNFANFIGRIRLGEIEGVSRFLPNIEPASRRDALRAVLDMHRGDSAGRAAIERLSSSSDDEVLLELLSSLFIGPYRFRGIAGPGVPESVYTDLGMRLLEAAVRARLRRAPFVQTVELFPPVRGRWNVVSGPMSGKAYHSTFMGFFGYDLYYPGSYADSFGKPVFSAASGRVVRVEDSNPDNPPSAKMIVASKMNIVIVEHEGNIRSIYAHIKQGSARVRVGDKVARGDQIAQIGNSGYTGGPHLHFEIASLDDDFTLPVRMSGLWRHNEDTGRFEPFEDPSVVKGKYSDRSYEPTSGGTSFTFDNNRIAKAADGTWNEIGPDGSVRRRFSELPREGGNLVLRDASRELVVRFPARGGVAFTSIRGGPWARYQVLIQD
jgi:murein DD-endopeptidase MepM/ murein hydrolase activator NlpD